MRQPDDDLSWLPPLALATVVLWAVVSCQEARAEQPMTPRDLTLNEARAAALSEPHDQVQCYQERQHGRTHVCITEAEWLRQRGCVRLPDGVEIGNGQIACRAMAESNQ